MIINELKQGQAAKFYVERYGWYIFPCHEVIDGQCTCEPERKQRAQNENKKYTPCRSPGKHPRIKRGVYGSSNDLETIQEWWALWPNAPIGLHCGESGLIAIDHDLYKDEYHGDELLNSTDTETVTSLTGGGGQHLLYRLPEGAKYKNSSEGLPEGVDVRGWGGYIILPPSTHPSGNQYQWELEYSPSECSIKPLPQTLVKIFDEIEEKKQANRERIHDVDFKKADVNDVREALKHIAPQGDYNDHWVPVLMAIHSQFPDEIGIALAEEWSPGYEGEIEQKFASFKSNGVTIGTLFHKAKEGGYETTYFEPIRIDGKITLYLPKQPDLDRLLANIALVQNSEEITDKKRWVAEELAIELGRIDSIHESTIVDSLKGIYTKADAKDLIRACRKRIKSAKASPTENKMYINE